MSCPTCLYSGLMEDRSLKWNLFGGHAKLIVEVRLSLSQFDVTVKFDPKVTVRNSEFLSGDAQATENCPIFQTPFHYGLTVSCQRDDT